MCHTCLLMLTKGVSLHFLPFSRFIKSLLRYLSSGWFDLNLAMHCYMGLPCNLLTAHVWLHLSMKVQEVWDKWRSVFSMHFLTLGTCRGKFLQLWPHFILISVFLVNFRPANFLIQILDVRAAQASTMVLYSQIQHLSLYLGSFGLLAWAELLHCCWKD